MNTQTGRTRRAKAIAFFVKHAGYSYDPKTETAAQGRRRCARSLANAEQEFLERQWTIEWADDWSVDHQKEYDCYEDDGPETCESAVLRDLNGKMLASLSCIDDATDEYRRVIRAELAEEALARV